MGRRGDLGADWNAIVTDWYCGSLQIEPEVGWEALRTVERLHPEAIDQAVQGGRNTFSLGRLVDLGLVLGLTERLDGFASVLSRVRRSERAAISELMVAAGFVRLGYQPTLEPEILGRRPDFSIAVDENGMVLVEVVTPEFSEVMRHLHEGLTEAANRICAALRGACVSVVFIAEPDTRAQEIVLAEASQLGIPDEGERVREIPGLAYIRIRRFTPETTTFEPLSPRPLVMLGAASAQINADQTGTRVNAQIAFSDVRADRFLEGEAKHFPRDTHNILVMDLSAIPRGLKSWRLLLERRFQPTLNRRFSAVILFQAMPEAKGIARHWVLMRNPYAHQPLPDTLFLRLDELS